LEKKVIKATKDEEKQNSLDLEIPKVDEK